ncbi:MAG: flagellar hook-length control protein FliK [Porticoccaceae bacterium]
MEIDSRITASALRLTTTSPDTRGWFAGQVVSARAVEAPRGDLVALQIGNRIYDARTSFAVRQGDQLLLQVIRTEPTPLLQLTATGAPPDPIKALLLTELPRQGGLTPLLARLAASVAADSRLPALSPAIVQAAGKLFGAFLESTQVRELGQLRSAVANAGTLLEARLAEGARSGQTPPLERDLKAGLLRLLQALPRETAASASGPPASPGAGAVPPMPRPPFHTLPQAPPQAAAQSPAPSAPFQTLPLLPPLAASQPQAQPRLATTVLQAETQTNFLAQFRGEVESSLARIQLQQLGSLPGDHPEHRVWLLELPIRHGAGADLWQLRVERDPEESERATGDEGNRRPIWSIRLAFDLTGLGPVHGLLRQQADRISIRLWAEAQSTVAMLKPRLAELRGNLVAAGVTVGDIHCHHGHPPEHARVARQSLVDDLA